MSFFFKPENGPRWYTPTAAAAVLLACSQAQSARVALIKRWPDAARATCRRNACSDDDCYTTTDANTPIPLYCHCRIFFVVLRFDLHYAILDVVFFIVSAEFSIIASSVIGVRISEKLFSILSYKYLISAVFGIATTMQIAVLQARSFAADNAKPVSCTLNQIIPTHQCILIICIYYCFHV